MTTIDIPVAFGGVSIGDETARLGIKVDRKLMTLEKADSLFCDRRIIGRLVLGHADDAPGQTNAGYDHVVEGAFDTKGFSVKAKAFSSGATFVLAELDRAEFSLFAKQTGRLIIDRVSEIPKPEKDDAGSERHPPGTLKAEGPWRDVPLTELFEQGKAIWKALAQADIATVGDLADYTATDQRLVDIEGIGPGKAQQIEDTLLEFWRDNPEASAE